MSPLGAIESFEKNICRPVQTNSYLLLNRIFWSLKPLKISFKLVISFTHADISAGLCAPIFPLVIIPPDCSRMSTPDSLLENRYSCTEQMCGSCVDMLFYAYVFPVLSFQLSLTVLSSLPVDYFPYCFSHSFSFIQGILQIIFYHLC